jgi:putative phosphoesterase
MVYRVRGNCDFDMSIPAEETLEFENARVFISHGHQYSVKWTLQEIAARAEELNCDAALFGHTHVSSLEAFGRRLLLNPGSASVPRNGQKPSFALLMINGNDVNAKIITM